jgi:dipeptidyl aminopeptidase/acylaminoacyl peptidase
MNRIVAGYGTWMSPLTAARVTAGLLRFDHLVVDGDDVYWAEGRATEAGRYVVVRLTRDGRISDATPPTLNVRTRVHEYGGGAFTVHRGIIYLSNFSDQRVFRIDPGGTTQTIGTEGCFYADFQASPDGRTLYCVREDHRRTGEPLNSIVRLAVDGSDEHVIASGADFYSDPAVRPDGARIAWLQWNHPRMPWDGTELYVADVLPDGSLGRQHIVAGGEDESIFQPGWSPAGDLVYVSDRTGWWNLYRAPAEPLWPMEAEFGKPLWTFSQSAYCFIDANRIAATFTEHGRWTLGILQIAPRAFERVDLPLEPADGVRVRGGDIVFIGGAPARPMCVARVAAASRDVEVIRTASADRIPEEWVSAAEAITFDSDGRDVHAFYYAPRNPGFEAPAGELPPLLVVSHGGPTAASGDVLDARLQFWTSRGFAVLDVNYGGSTGFGRAYRDRLKGQWGLVDVADCVNGARHLVATGRADPKRLAIRGGSAGGYTTLAALTFYDVFNAGASHYGVSDIEVLARDTHKFESRYLDSLVGPYPAARDVYRARSPIHFTDRLSAALILFQGLEDKVVPPNQAVTMADAVRRKGLPVAYVPFEGEQHGFRKAENIVRALEAELYFYGAVFRFTPADPIDPIPIDNLRLPDNQTP